MELWKFGAEWCGPCRQMDKQLQDFTACPYKTFDINEESDEMDALVERFKIRSIPVTILMDGDEEVHRWVGYFDLKEVEQYL